MTSRRNRSILLLAAYSSFLVFLLFLTGNGAAQASQAIPPAWQPLSIHPQQTLTATQPVSGTQLAPVEVPATVPVTVPVAVPVTVPVAVPVTVPVAVPVTVTVVVTVTATPPAATPEPKEQLPVVVLQPDEVLTGTVVLNRAAAAVFFFLDDDLYELPPNRATGLALGRPLAGLTLFSCTADVTDNPACDWVSYPIRRSAFYEISADTSVPGPKNLRLAMATPPPLDVAWFQNRTGADAVLLRGDESLEIQNTGVITLQAADTLETSLHVSHCLQTANQRICEWLPTTFAGGVYYALRESRRAAGINGVTLVRTELEPLLIQEALITPTPTPEPAPLGIFCQTQIPSLNVRSGPSTDFLIAGKLRTDSENGGRVLVIGRTESNEWLSVDPRFVDGGWVANVPQWLTCEGETDSLRVIEVDAERPVRPVVPPQAAPESTPTPSPTPAPVPEETEALPAPGELGPEQARLIVSNAFDHTIRFTLDAALHGLPEGTPSEYDLEPGQSIQFVIRAGRVQFSASTPWRGGAGNAEFELLAGITQEIFLHFVPSTTNSDQWEMRYLK